MTTRMIAEVLTNWTTEAGFTFPKPDLSPMDSSYGMLLQIQVQRKHQVMIVENVFMCYVL